MDHPTGAMLKSFREEATAIAKEFVNFDDLRIGYSGSTCNEAKSVFEKLQLKSAELLALEGPVMVLRPLVTDQNRAVGVPIHVGGAEILRWRYLTFALPPSILCAAATPAEIPQPPFPVRILDPSIAPQGPTAVHHVHYGAAEPFEDRWQNLGESLLSGGLRTFQNALGEKGHNPLGKTIPIGAWVNCLVRTFQVRALFLAHLDHSGPIDQCSSCANPPERGNLQWRMLTDPAADNAPVYLAGLSKRPWGPMDVAFQHKAMVMALEPQRPKEARLLLQYLRVKTLLYQSLVMQPDQQTLKSFSDVDKRSRAYPAKTLHLPGFAAEMKALEPIKIASVEVRTIPADWIRKPDLQSPLGPGDLPSGWILHPSRGEGVTTAKEGKSAHQSPPRRPAILRSLAELRRDLRVRPRILDHVCGLDIAGHEREGPLYDFVRELIALREVARKVAAKAGGKLRPLRLTYHTGEDFDHIATGLRAVQEPLVWGLMARGDRLGHALALGLDPAEWAGWTQKRLGTPVLKMRAWDRLLDLGWLRFANRHYQLSVSFDENSRWAQEALELLKMADPKENDGVFAAQALEQAETLWWRLGKSTKSGDWIAELRRRPPKAMLDNNHPVDLNLDMERLGQISQAIGVDVARSGITIEVNPSSNLLVAGMPNPLAQPMFRLRPLLRTERHAQAISISPDDPLTFATSVADEYAYAWAGMVVGADQPAHYARDWLEEAAACSMRARFTR
jgi:hypothetical protein